MTKDDKLITQDNKREKQIADYCGLISTGRRIGYDAVDVNGFPFELKSLTKRGKGVSTARQVHPNKIATWESQYWVIAIGDCVSEGMVLTDLYVAHPSDLKVFFQSCKDRILAKWMLTKPVLDAAILSGVDKEAIAEAERVIEVGTRLDDPCIPISLVRSLKKLPVDNSASAKSELAKFVLNRPLSNSMV